jgi:hypothetical protein
MKVVFIFVDGMGLAPAGPDNPLSTTPTPHLNRNLDGRSLTLEAAGYRGRRASLFAVDTTLGVPGCPQSATGQTTLFTGVNAAKAAGRHINGYPNQLLRNILAREGMLKKMVSAGYSATFLNTYRPEFFVIKNMKEGGFSASTMLNLYAGLPFRTFDDMAAGKAVYFDITNQVLPSLGHHVPPVSPETAGERLAGVAAEYDFLLFEHFLTDIIGHRRNREQAAEVVEILDRFLGSVLANLDLSSTLLLLTSDHGNLEDLSSRTHTRNPVPLLLAGAGHAGISPPPDLTGIMPLVMDALSSCPP